MSMFLTYRNIFTCQDLDLNFSCFSCKYNLNFSRSFPTHNFQGLYLQEAHKYTSRAVHRSLGSIVRYATLSLR